MTSENGTTHANRVVVRGFDDRDEAERFVNDLTDMGVRPEAIHVE